MRSQRRLAHIYLAIAVFSAAQIVPVQALQPPSSELVGQLTKELSVTPQQATGGAGALFGVAKSRLNPADFSKIAAVVPGMGSFLQAAPSTGGGTGLSSLTGMLHGKAGSMATAASQFQKLGLSPSMVGKFVPIITQFVKAKGGASVASLLAGALK